MAGYHFGCPHCRAKLEVPDASRAGRTVTCPKCGQSLLIPPPPPMGVALPQSTNRVSTPGEPSSIVVSQEPGFKRPLSPAKAFSDQDIAPPSSTSGYERLPPVELPESTEIHTITAGDEIEGYSFTVPEKGEAIPPPVHTPKKKRNKDKEEAPHPWEDPKRQLMALIVFVGIVGGVTAWWRSPKTKEESTTKTPVNQSAPPEKTVPTPLPTSPLPGGTIGSDVGIETAPRTGLPGANAAPPAPEPAVPMPPPAPASPDGGLPGASPSDTPMPPEDTPVPATSTIEESSDNSQAPP